MASFESDELVVLINDTTLTSTASLQSALAEANQTGFTIRPLSNTYLTSLQDFTSFRTKYHNLMPTTHSSKYVPIILSSFNFVMTHHKH